MEEKETVDPIADLNECIEAFLYGAFIKDENLPMLRHTIQACFTMTHFLCHRVDPKMVLMSEKLRAELEGEVDEEELHQLESDVSDMTRCMAFFSSMQDDMMKFTRRRLGKTQDELEMMALIANELVERDKPDNED